MIMDEQVEEQVELEYNLEEYEGILYEYLYSFGFQEYSFFLTIDEFFEEELPLEEDTCQENLVQTRSQITRAP